MQKLKKTRSLRGPTNWENLKTWGHFKTSGWTTKKCVTPCPMNTWVRLCTEWSTRSTKWRKNCAEAKTRCVWVHGSRKTHCSSSARQTPSWASWWTLSSPRSRRSSTRTCSVTSAASSTPCSSSWSSSRSTHPESGTSNTFASSSTLTSGSTATPKTSRLSSPVHPTNSCS